MSAVPSPIPSVTIVIEWENAIDVEDRWTLKAMAGLQAELERERASLAEPPRVMVLFDERAVREETIRGALAKVAPRLGELARVELVPTPGLTYYRLKNHGIARADTELSVMLDSDARPLPGWLRGLTAPFEDPEVVAVGGFTTLGYETVVDKAMALSWIFDLPSELDRSARRMKINANNCAVRTEWFNAHPFPDLPAFKKQCGFWLRDLVARGFKWVRTVDARTLHAPHPGLRFLAWRAWTAGLDRDYQVAQTVAPSRLGRIGRSFSLWGKKLRRSTKRVIGKRREVELPLWQVPAALLVANGYFTVLFVGQLASALTRSFAPLPELATAE